MLAEVLPNTAAQRDECFVIQASMSESGPILEVATAAELSTEDVAKLQELAHVIERKESVEENVLKPEAFPTDIGLKFVEEEVLQPEANPTDEDEKECTEDKFLLPEAVPADHVLKDADVKTAQQKEFVEDEVLQPEADKVLKCAKADQDQQTISRGTRPGSPRPTPWSSRNLWRSMVSSRMPAPPTQFWMNARTGRGG